jgi:hypothetical protein
MLFLLAVDQRKPKVLKVFWFFCSQKNDSFLQLNAMPADRAPTVGWMNVSGL